MEDEFKKERDVVVMGMFTKIGCDRKILVTRWQEPAKVQKGNF